MEVRLFEDVESARCSKDFIAEDNNAASTVQFLEGVKDQFSDDDGDVIQANDVVDLTDDREEENHSHDHSFVSLLTWLRNFFESNLQTKLKNLINFALCEYCKRPINDIFDMVFVEQYHLVCLFKWQYSQDLNDQTVASIQMLKIDLLEAFKNIKRARWLIRTRPQFCSFLESLKSEISQRICLSCGVTSDNVQLHSRETHTTADKRERYVCRFCTDQFQYEYLQLRHEMQHPLMVMEKHSGRVLRNEQFLCPYCRVRFDDSQRMQQHQDAHEKAIKFQPPKGLRTYRPSTVRARKRLKVKIEKVEDNEPYAVKCYRNLRSWTKCKLKTL